jgi:F0F1-type ATP synthase assembly protein I
LINSPKFKKYLPYLSLGSELAVALTLPILGGYWLDQRFEVAPWGLLCGIILGLVLMVSIFIRVIRDVSKK